MGASLMQLVAYGAQDIYLTHNPQITYFKVVYRRHTNFAIEAIEQTVLGSKAFGQKFNVTVSRNGDLINRVILEVDVPALTYADGTADDKKLSYTKYLGNRIIKEMWVEIGGQKIELLESNFNWAYDQLTEGDNDGYGEMTGRDVGQGGGKLYVPLKFWFADNIGLALPLIALQYHDVKIHVELNKWDNLIKVDTSTAKDMVKPSVQTDANVKMYIDYVYLDKEERRRFAQVTHEYLIHQVQSSGQESRRGCKCKVRLNFNHPCKELLWLIQDDCTPKTRQWYQFLTCKSATLLLNNQERFSSRDGKYFSLVQNWQGHSNVPFVSEDAPTGGDPPAVHTYSFALNPEEHQPSGSCNMSRIDNTTLEITMPDSSSNTTHTIEVFAVNYNVLRIMNGMGGLAYAN